MSDYIYERAARLIRMCETRDPFRVAKESGIYVRFQNDFTRLKGMYTVMKRNRFIFINAGLPERKQRIVCAHELGHDILHRALAADNALREFMLYDMTSRPEYEANVFAAHLLLDEKEIMRRARGGYDAYQIAAYMNTDINLMLVKMNEMNRQGYKFNLPYVPHGDFLADD